MFNIFIVFTVHLENGNCNAQELYKIIESIYPEIIFEELSEIAFDRCYNLQNLSTLETTAIKRYKQNHIIKHIPVVGKELEIHDKLTIMTKNKSYCDLINKLSNFGKELGFQFLNSSLSIEVFDQIKETEQLILKEKDDEILYRINNNSDREIDRYENEIIKNIYNYSKSNKYNNAILFLGAAHRKSLIEKTNYLNRKQEANINWIIYTFEVPLK